MSDEEANVPTVFGGNVKVNVADMAALAAKAQQSAQNSPRGGAPNGSDFMNFSGKRGIYTIGQDKRRIENDELWVVDVTSFEEGWVCWKGGQSPSSRMANIFTGVPIAQPEPDELGPFDSSKGDGWYQGKAMILRSLAEGNQQGYFKINSVSGVSAMSELIGEFGDRAKAGEPCWPVLYLDVEEFESQGFKNFKPVFDVQGWLDNDGIAALADGADIDELLGGEPEPEPKKVEKKPAKASGRRRRAS